MRHEYAEIEVLYPGPARPVEYLDPAVAQAAQRILSVTRESWRNHIPNTRRAPEAGDDHPRQRRQVPLPHAA